ncbi:MAG: WD40 repeat domain-containing serine/threonine-protein kinase [Planctomycetes bacterium]|nr:WD40 repeat domain-containing serine/threonine-protein kinase [Planctomycetota bacterium]
MSALASLLGALDPAARTALEAALRDGRLPQAELAQAWAACRGSSAELSRWLAHRLAHAETRAEPPAPAAAPQRVGPYVVERELARGGMGVVHVAVHAQLGRRVALKLLPAGAGGELAERFQLEAQAAARLKHPHVVGVHEVGVERGQPWLAMDLIEGESLHARLGREGPLPEDVAAPLLEKVARAVAYAHARGVLHRDVKPHNVLLDQAGEPFLADFGLAKDVSAEAKGVTVSGQTLGTPAYMPPEQAAGDLQLVDRRADVYALGATLYHALTGRPPYEGATAMNVVTKVLTVDPPRPSSLRPGLDRDLETIVLRAMEREPQARYPTALSLADDLRRWREGAPLVARPVSLAGRLWRRARRNRAASAAAGAAALLGLVVWGAVTVRLDRARADARREEARAREAEGAAATARDEAVRANARLRVLRRLDGATRLLSLGRYVEAEAEFARAEGEAGAMAGAGAALEEAARRGARQAAQHLGRPVPGADPQAPALGCAFGPRGRVLALVEGGAVVVRDLVRGDEVLRAPVGACEGAWLAFTPDGETLVVALKRAGGRSLEAAWDLRGGQARWRREVERVVGGLAVDPTGALAAIFDLAGVTTLVDPRSGEPAGPALRGDARPGCERNQAAAYAAAFGPPEAGGRLAVAYSDGLIGFWDVATGAVDVHNARAARRALAWPPRGALVEGALALVVGDALGRVEVWDLQASSPERIVVADLQAGAGLVRSLVVRPRDAGGEALLAARTEDGSVTVWDEALRPRRRLHLRDADAGGCALSPDGRLLATSGPGPARLWDPGPRRLRGAGPVALSPDGARVALCRPRFQHVGADLVAVDLSDGHERRVELPAPYGPRELLAAAIDAAGVVWLTTREENERVQERRLWAWDPDGAAGPRAIDLAQPAASLALHRDGALLGPLAGPARGPAPADVVLRGLPTGDERGRYAWHTLTVTACQALPDGRFVTGSLDGTAAWWRPGAERPERLVDARAGDARAWSPPGERPAPGHVAVADQLVSLAYSPERGLLAAGFGDGTVRLWRDDGAAHEPPTLEGHEHSLVLCAFQPGGDLLVTASREGKVRVWDVPLGTVLRTIEVPAARLEAAAVSADGRRLALASAGEVWVHDLAR